jgi:hypothetical protein
MVENWQISSDLNRSVSIPGKALSVSAFVNVPLLTDLSM